MEHRPFLSPSGRPFSTSQRLSGKRSPQQLAYSVVLVLFLFAGLLGNGNFLASTAFAAGKPPIVTAHLTLQQFLQEGQRSRAYHGPFVFPKQPLRVALAHGEHLADYKKLLPSAEPPTMQPLQQVLSSMFLSGGATVKPLDLVSSDKRLEVQIQPGSFDLSQAKTTKGATLGANTSLTLTITELQGYFIGQTDGLGEYQVQITDALGTAVQDIKLRQPVTIIYHYDPQVLDNLELDPGHLLLSWPQLISVARQQHQSTSAYIIPSANNTKTHTLTGQSSILGNGIFDTGAGNPDNASPPKSLFGSVQGNSGQLSYSYPLTVASGPLGTVPQLVFSYSSQSTNDRHNHASPANDFGEGWSLSMGAISADEYPGKSAGGSQTWYSISGVDNVSDLLVPNPKHNTQYLTEHISQLKIQQITVNGQPCFNVWDTSGNEYIFGCTSDSLQYYTDSSGTRHNYRWDLEHITPANEGPGTDGRYLSISYEQDKASSNGYTTVRDAVIKQITYGDGSTTAGMVDFSYQGPYSDGQWVTQYTSSDDLRNDDPVDFSGGFSAPLVMSTFIPLSVTSYVGSDNSNTNKDYSYSFSFTDTNYVTSCTDDWSQTPMYCAGEHLLKGVTPIAYKNGVGQKLPALVVGYTPDSNTFRDDYYDSSEPVPSLPSQDYHVTTYWRYLNSYDNLANGVGATISYQTAYNNSNGTPVASNGDNRYDALYCSTYTTDCTSGTFDWPYNHAWSEQVVTQITSMGKDSGNSNLLPATTTFKYRLTYAGSTSCPADSSGDTDCVGYSWIPPTDGDFMDFYHGEFRGFGEVDITSPAGDLTVQHYAATDGWGTPESNAHNYTAGLLEDEEVYAGNSTTSPTSNPLLLETTNLYAGYNLWDGSGTQNSCNGTYNGVYPPCEVMVISSQVQEVEGNYSANISPPKFEHDYTYDDYNRNGGLGDYGSSQGGSYHNLWTVVTTSSNAPTVTQQYSYQPTNSTANGWIYYDVNKLAHSEIDDNNGNIYDCQSFTYDQNANSGVPSPAAGFLTTINWYNKTNCTSPSFGSPWITTYVGYDLDGNQVMSVDGVGQAHPTFYGSGGISGKNGCTLSQAPSIYPASAWTASTYTACTVYDGTSALPTSTTNAFGQSNSIQYDPTQGDLPKSTTDANGQTTGISYSYDSSGNLTTQVKEPGESDSYTRQSERISSCTNGEWQPCMEIEGQTDLYNQAETETFYDSQGRAVETRSPGPDDGYDTISYTIYNDSNHSVLQIVPFEVLAGSGWLDPNGALDKNGHTPTGTASFYDALGRVIAVQDPSYHPPDVPGIACSATLSGTYTACTNYTPDTASGDNTVYDAAVNVDPNSHVSESFVDAMGNVRYTQEDGGAYGGTLTPNEQKSITYNVINEPTTVTVTDLSPHSNQVVKTATTTMHYDGLGRLTQVIDLDRGTHSYTYDADSQMLTDTSGTRIIGYNEDLLGRVGCIQLGSATSNADGSCTGSTQPLVQNTYDSNILGTQGSNDFPLGRLTKSVATTYYPEGTSVNSTEKWQYDQRGRIITQQLKFSLPSSWNVTNALPTYQESLTYNEVDQLSTTTTSAVGQSGLGYSFTQVYDGTLGLLTGLSTNGSPTTANLASLNYNVNDLPGKISYYTSAGGNLAYEQFTYDGDQRLAEEMANWQTGSGQSGQLFDQSQSYDLASNVTSETTTMQAITGQSGTNTETQVFCYDTENRLIWAGNTGTPQGFSNGTCGTATPSSGFTGASYSSSFVYTHLGQLYQGPVAGTGGSKQYLYCSTSTPHQLQGIYPSNATCSSPGTALYSVQYDAWGNVTQRSYNGQTATLSYDGLDHMVEWQVPGTNTAWNAYDASGTRALQRTTVGSTTTLTVYAFGLEEHSYDGSGNLQSSTYYYDLAGQMIGELKGNGTLSTNFFLTDGLGSVLATVSNLAGGAAVLGNQLYSPYGDQLYTSGNMGTSKGYTGQYNDAVSGLDYYLSRYYDPVAGTFLSADDVQGNPEGMNPYNYVGDNPETNTDPSGQMYRPITGGGGGTVVEDAGGGGGSTTVPQGIQNSLTDVNLDPGPDMTVTSSNESYTYDSQTSSLTITSNGGNQGSAICQETPVMGTRCEPIKG